MLDTEYVINQLIKQFKKIKITLKEQQEMYVTHELETDNKIKNLQQSIDELKQKTDKLVELNNMKEKIYSKEELYNLKSKYSWRQLSKITGIKECTLKYRIGTYKNSLLEDMEV